MTKHETPELHYDKDALVAEYEKTYSTFMTALFIGVGGAVLCFFAAVVYLGGWSHTRATPFVETFGDRIEYDYDGTKLPLFGGPETPEQPNH